MSGSVSTPTLIHTHCPRWTHTQHAHCFLAFATSRYSLRFTRADILIFITFPTLGYSIFPSPSIAARRNPGDVGNSVLLHRRLANRNRHNTDWRNISRAPSMLFALRQIPYRLPCLIPLILTNARLDLSGPEHHESWYSVSSMSWVTASCFARFVAASLFAPWPIRARHHLAFSGRCMSCPVMWHCLCPLCQRRSNLFSTSVREFA